ncbi:MAG: amidohydrolase family protein, partial [Pseudomonadales bacterium]|nr:amidohydrolase family protein [Pseudomonadales bacterium]
RAAKMVSSGITSARDLGGGRWLELEIRDRILAGDLTGPRLICAGQPVTSPQGHCHFWGGEAADADEAKQVIARQIDHGVDLIKVMATGGNLTKGSRPADAQFDVETLSTMVSLSNNHDLGVAAHCHGTEGIRNAADAGVTTIEHCSWVNDEGWARGFDNDVAGTIAERGIRVSPTVNLGWKRRIGSGDYERLVQETFPRLKSAGATLIASTDAGIPGVYHHDLPRALPVFAHFAGLSPVEALRAATSDCADAIGLGAITGRIASGYSADLLLLESDPLSDLAALDRSAEVWARGSKVNG